MGAGSPLQPRLVPPPTPTPAATGSRRAAPAPDTPTPPTPTQHAACARAGQHPGQGTLWLGAGVLTIVPAILLLAGHHLHSGSAGCSSTSTHHPGRRKHPLGEDRAGSCAGPSPGAGFPLQGRPHPVVKCLPLARPQGCSHCQPPGQPLDSHGPQHTQRRGDTGQCGRLPGKTVPGPARPPDPWEPRGPRPLPILGLPLPL